MFLFSCKRNLKNDFHKNYIMLIYHYLDSAYLKIRYLTVILLHSFPALLSPFKDDNGNHCVCNVGQMSFEPLQWNFMK